MPEPEYEVNIPGPGGNPGHSETEWRTEDGAIHVKKVDDHYECFWYTDATAIDFVTVLEELVAEHLDAPNHLLQFTHAVIGGEKVSIENSTHAEKLASSQKSTYIECKLGEVIGYWMEEGPMRNDLPNLPYLVHISGPFTSLAPLEALYRNLAPKRLAVEDQDELIKPAIKFIQR